MIPGQKKFEPGTLTADRAKIISHHPLIFIYGKPIYPAAGLYGMPAWQLFEQLPYRLQLRKSMGPVQYP